MNSSRHKSRNIIGPGCRISEEATLVAPVRLYGVVVVDKTSSIGKYTYIGTGTYVQHTHIGNYCSIARDIEIGAKAHPLTMLSSHSFQYNNNHFANQPEYQITKVKQPRKRDHVTEIGSDVWIGTKSVIRGGVTIGHGAVIGSSSVVTKDVRPYAIVAGAPAKEIRMRFDEETVSRLLESRWWELDPTDMNCVDFNDIDAALNEIEARRADYKNLINQTLLTTLKNSSTSKNGVIWFDIEKSYAEPEILKDFDSVNIIESAFGSGNFKIEKAWHNPEKNHFALKIDGAPKTIPKGTVTFTFRTINDLPTKG